MENCQIINCTEHETAEPAQSKANSRQIRVVDQDIRLIPYYPNYDVALPWYQDRGVCKQVDNRDEIYDLDLLKNMYDYLSERGECYYIEYQGTLCGDVTLQDDGDIAIVVCKEFQNKHIGRRCIKEMLTLAGEKGRSQVKATIYSFNGQSRKTFLACGFKQLGEEEFECATGDGSCATGDGSH